MCTPTHGSSVVPNPVVRQEICVKTATPNKVCAQDRLVKQLAIVTRVRIVAMATVSRFRLLFTVAARPIVWPVNHVHKATDLHRLVLSNVVPVAIAARGKNVCREPVSPGKELIVATRPDVLQVSLVSILQDNPVLVVAARGSPVRYAVIVPKAMNAPTANASPARFLSIVAIKQVAPADLFAKTRVATTASAPKLPLPRLFRWFIPTEQTQTAAPSLLQSFQIFTQKVTR